MSADQLPASPRFTGSPALRGALIIFALQFFIATATRIALLIQARHDVAWDWSVAGAFAAGIGFDLLVSVYVVLPWVMLVSLVPAALWKRAGGFLTVVVLWIYAALLLFGGVAEWFFWDEFQVRFNFVAVDYLVWTQEVWGNIRESYPIYPILGTIALGAAAIVWLLSRKGAVHWIAGARSRPQDHFFVPAAALGLAACALLVSQRTLPKFANDYNRELGKNGLFSFGAAFIGMEIDYTQMYRTLPGDEAFTRVRGLLSGPAAPLAAPGNVRDLRREIRHPGAEHRWNVILICMESMSADFMGRFRSKKGITPNLDRLAGESLFFSNLYATGTRTVRGMEALTLALPPTPGQAMIYRPYSTGLYSLGTLFGSRGYDCAFIYGGDGRFDYMNRYFGGNGYRVLDKGAWNAADITHETSWGACDEDLFARTMREADAAHAAGRPFHYFCMTTSNHRPFQFPDGRIPRKSDTGRDAAVMYADYAVGRLIEEAQRHPWFENTLFVFCADHCASSAGKVELDVRRFHIPAMVWNPKLVPAREVKSLCSQIDLMPTVFGLMNWSYTSLFFGHDVLSAEYPKARHRAFVSNYQKVALLRDKQLAILKPPREFSLYQVHRRSGALLPDDSLMPVLDDAVAWYQSASWLCHHQLRLSEGGITPAMAILGTAPLAAVKPLAR